MTLFKTRGMLTAVASVAAVVGGFSCGRAPKGVSEPATGMLELQIRLVSALGKQAHRTKTEYDSLVVEVNGDEGTNSRYVRPLQPELQFLIDTLKEITTGGELEIRVTTVNKAGETVHEDSAGVQSVRIDPNVIQVMHVVLVPVRGSIYLQLGSIPTSVDSLGALFAGENGEVWETKVGRSPKVYMSIDGIPHNTQGTLTVAGFSADGDTLYRAAVEVTVSAREVNSIQLQFTSTPGGLALSVTLELPGTTVVSGSMGDATVARTERGDLIITEIMYAANDSEYIEVFNPEKRDVTYDSLIIDIDGTRRLFLGVRIDAEDYFVFGRKELPWVDMTHATSSALNLSGNGNWITLIAGDTVIDQVIFTGGTNEIEWPRVSGKRSVCLKNNSYDCSDNNFGRNWSAATEMIDGTSSQYGTPHAL